MFNNIGKKIKILAQVICWIGIIFSVIFGLFAGNMVKSFFTGLLMVVLYSLIAWASSFVLYGFGELVENSKHNQ